MYMQLGHYLHRMLTRKELWKDGDLWTGVVAGVGVAVWTYVDPAFGTRIRAHFAQLLTLTGIIFGFASSSLIFYAQSTASWSPAQWVQAMARKVVDWYVWTVLCLLVLLGYILVFWSALGTVQPDKRASAAGYGVLAFLVTYIGGLIINNALTIWWGFNHREELKSGSVPSRAPAAGDACWPKWFLCCTYGIIILVLVAPFISWIWFQHSIWQALATFAVAVVVCGVLWLAAIGLHGIFAADEQPEGTEDAQTRTKSLSRANGSDGKPATTQSDSTPK